MSNGQPQPWASSLAGAAAFKAASNLPQLRCLHERPSPQTGERICHGLSYYSPDGVLQISDRSLHLRGRKTHLSAENKYWFQTVSRDTKLAMVSQFLGFMLDAFDMALVLLMAPILTKVFISGTGSAAWQYIVIVLSYSITIPRSTMSRKSRCRLANRS